MFELGAEEWQLDFPTVYSAKNNWMSDHWENVTDNVEALLDMVLANVPALRFQKVPTNVDYVIRLFSFTVVSLLVVLKEVC
jgi:predicted membrane GTPase involved in stress response